MSIRAANVHLGLINTQIRQFLLKRCDGVISNTFAGIEQANISSFRGVRYWVLPNTIEAEAEALSKLPLEPPSRWVLVMLGNIKIFHKGYDIAVELAQSLLKKGFLFELRIAGRPDELPELEAIVARAGIRDFVRFCGEVSLPEAFLKEGHLFLLLSRFEGMPNALLEALNVGLPAIVTEVGDLGGLKKQGAPFTLIPVGDTVAAVAAVETATERWAETRATAERGRAWVQAHFSETACRAGLRNILDEVLKP